MNKKPSVFEFIENIPKELPQKLTVTRTSDSKHQLRLLARAFKLRLGATPVTLTHEKGAADYHRAIIEEPSILDQDHKRARLLVLENFSKEWVTALKPPPRAHIIAETEEGELQPTPHNPKQKRNALKVLMTLLEEELDVKEGMSLRELLKLEWSSLAHFAEYEALLRKAYLMGWDEERTGKELHTSTRVNLLTAIKRASIKELLGAVSRMGTAMAHQALLTATANSIHHRALKQMGLEAERAAKEMGISEWAHRELEEAGKILTAEDLRQMAARLVRLDRLPLRFGQLGLELILLNAPIRVAKT